MWCSETRKQRKSKTYDKRVVPSPSRLGFFFEGNKSSVDVLKRGHNRIMQYRVSCVVIVALETPAFRLQWRASSRFEVHCEQHLDPCALLPITESELSVIRSSKNIHTGQELAGLEPCLFFHHHTRTCSVYCTYAEFIRHQVHVRCMQVTCYYSSSRAGGSVQDNMQNYTQHETIIYTFTFVHIRMVPSAKGKSLPEGSTAKDPGKEEQMPGLEKVFLVRKGDLECWSVNAFAGHWPIWAM